MQNKTACEEMKMVSTLSKWPTLCSHHTDHTEHAGGTSGHITSNCKTKLGQHVSDNVGENYTIMQKCGASVE